MKVLHVSPENHIDVLGGRGIFLRNILKHQNDAKILTMATGAECEQDARIETIEPFMGGMPASPTEWLRAVNLGLVKQGLRLFKTWRPEVIHIHDSDTAEAGLTLAEHLNVPAVYTMHLSAHASWLEGMSRSAFQHALIQWEMEAIRKSRIVHVCSQYYSDQFVGDPVEVVEGRAWYIAPKPAIIPNGVDYERLNAIKPALQGGSHNVFFAGRFAIGKGIETLVEAAKMNPLWRLFVAGQFNGHKEEEENYPPTAALNAFERDNPGRLVRLGHIAQEDMISVAKACDVWVAPSWHCPFELVGLEAMAAGVPLVATDTGAFKEYCVDGQNSLLARPGDANSLALAVNAVLDSSKEFRGALVAAAQQTAQRLSWKATNDMLEGLYYAAI